MMIGFNLDYDCNSENEVLSDILEGNKNYTLPFQYSKDYFTYKENNNSTDYNSKNLISIQNNNLTSNELQTNIFPNEPDNDSNKGENETIENKAIFYIKKTNNNRVNENFRNENQNLNLENNIIEDNNNNNRGRNKRNSNKKGEHNKKSEDNIINKIKAYFINTFIRYLIIEFSLNKNIELKKLPTKFIGDVTKKNNERLFDMKIKDILCEQEISSKYSTCDRFENKKIIEKIYKENKEIKVIKILELTFEELFIIFRRKLNDPEDKEELEKIKHKIESLDLLEENNKYKGIENLIKEQKKMNGEEYIEKIKNLCLGFKKWFNDKNKRKSN